MSIPPSPYSIVVEALAAVRADPQHDLSLGYRQAVWAQFGPRIDDSQAVNSLGHQRRTALAVITVQHVLPIWEAVWPRDTRPHRLLAEAEQVSRGTLDTRVATGDGEQFSTWLGYVIMEYEDKIPLYVGFSAVHALFVALWDEQFDPIDINFSRTDAEVDPNDYDTSFWAAAAYANGALWEPNSNSVKRREFWEWWLTAAVPKAWESVP